MRRRALAWSPTNAMGAVLLISQIAMAAAGLIIARALGPEGRGIVTAATAWGPTLTYLALLGMNTSVGIRVAGSDRREVGQALGSGMVFAAVCGGGLAIVSAALIPQKLSHLGGGIEALSTIILIGIPVGMATEILSSIILAMGDLRRTYAIRLVSPLVMLIVAAGAVGARSITPGVVVVATALMSVLAMAIAAWGVPWHTWRVDGAAMVKDLQVGVKAHAASVLGLVNLRLDVLVMSLWIPGGALGYYAMANNLMFPITTFAAARAILLLPKAASTFAASGPKVALGVVRRDAAWALAPAAGGALLVGLAAPLVIPALLGPPFAPTVLLAWILLPGFVARAYASVVAAGLIGIGRPRPAWIAEFAALVATVSLLPLMLPRWGVVGAAIASSAAYSVSAITSAVFVTRSLKTCSA